MKKNKAYKYIGRDGIIVSRVLLDGINHIPMLILSADEGKILTDGEKKVYSITIEADQITEWKEIADKNN